LKIALPPDAMVVIVGIAGSGKSTFAGARFAPTEILSSDAFRAMVADDEADQSASVDAFAMLHAALRFRLRRGRLSVLDATNVEEWSRRELLDIAARERRPAVAIVLDLSMEVCLKRLSRRGVRPVPAHAVRRQQRELHRSLPTLAQEGFHRADDRAKRGAQRNVPKEPRPTRRCEIIESTPERLMQSRDPVALPLRDDRRIANGHGAAQGGLSPTFRPPRRPFHRLSPHARLARRGQGDLGQVAA